MGQPLSCETIELLERAQRAIDHSVRLREETRQLLQKAERRQFEFDLRLRRESASRRTTVPHS